jgi:GDPmannose 4,6-dehydratase
MAQNKSALIIGIRGQDGAYLAQFLLNKGYAVSGTSRDVEGSSWKNLESFGIRKHIQLITADLVEITTLVNALRRSSAEEVYSPIWAIIRGAVF